MANWLTREQAKELQAVPDRSPRRDVILALLAEDALRRNELAELECTDYQAARGEMGPGRSWVKSRRTGLLLERRQSER
jgi:integrase